MPEDQVDDLDELDGSTLRKKLEKALGENKKLRDDVAGFKARSVITEKGFTLVKPEDLAGVDPDKVEERAAQLLAAARPATGPRSGPSREAGLRRKRPRRGVGDTDGR